MAVIRDFIDGQFRDDELEPVGIGGFTTAARINESIVKTREVPATPLEDGSYVNDHIIRNPIQLSIEGQVSDVFQLPSPALGALTDGQRNIGVISQYAPERTQTQIQKINAITADVQNAIDQVDSVISNAQQFAGFLGFTGEEGKTNTEKFIDFMDSVYESDVLIAIDGPFRTYKNMAVTSWSYDRNVETKSISFNIEAQELRFAQTIFVEVQAAQNPARNTNGQTEGVSDKGVQDGAPVPQSLLSSLTARLTG